MKVGFETGYYEEYWRGWPWVEMMGGSERIVVEVAAALATQGHSVTVRLPRPSVDRVWRGVRWIGLDAPRQEHDVVFLADCFDGRDHGVRGVLVANRSDPPVHTDFDELIFLSAHHAKLMGHEGRPHVGGGVGLADYAVMTKRPRDARKVICTSSPDRCPAASDIGRDFEFVHTYRPVGNVGVEFDRQTLIYHQQTAMAHVYPLDPRRPSDFFSMSVLESLAAGTPVLVSNADSMPELWSDCTYMLPLPIRLAEWTEAVEELLANKRMWQKFSDLGKKKAADLTWDRQAQRYLEAACR